MTDTAKIQTTIQRYFDGLYDSDTDALKQAFHPAAVIAGYGRDGTVKMMTRDQFLGFVATIPSPKAAGVDYDMEVMSSTVTGTVAAVTVRDFYLGNDFTDHLHLIDTGDDWQITAKAFHAVKRG